MIKVFIDGQEGTTGLRINERFSAREDVTVLQIPAEHRKNAEARAEFINSSDVTFLCLPDAAAIEAVAMAGDKVKIIDASTAHRTAEGWAYGFPELCPEFKEKIRGGNRVAVPGCHAGGFISLAYPLVKSGVLGEDYPLSCTSLTGYSGGGKKMIAAYENPERDRSLSSPRQYGIEQKHKHLKEMQYVCRLTEAPLFMPIVGDFYSGMEVSVPLRISALKGMSGGKAVWEFFADYYAGQELVKVMPYQAEGVFEDKFIPANHLSGKDGMQIYVCGNDERVLLVSLFDNLGKGASGAAVQNMNIMFGLEQSKGLNI